MQARDVASHDHQHRRARVLPAESDHGIRLRTLRGKRAVFSLRKHRRVFVPKREQTMNRGHLNTPVAPVLQQLAQIGVGDFIEPLPPLRVIDRAAVIGIDEAEIPQLAALIEIGHAGAGEF